jgi:hypothetical protein
MLRHEFMSGEAVALPLAPPVEQRAEPRRACEGMRATLFLGRAAYGARVGNISESGAMIKATAKPFVDDPVVIAIEGYAPIRATVRWSKEGRIGLQFGPVLLLA